MTKKTTKAPKAVRLEPNVVTEMPIGVLRPDPDQPRKSFDEAALLALADNIRLRGIQQPLLVREVGGTGGIMIIDGERRWRAAKLAKLKTVPALLVADGIDDDGQLRLDQVSVNQLREQLTPMDLARVLRGLKDAMMTANEISAALAKQGLPAMKPAAIDELAELVNLPEWAQAMVNSKQVAPKLAVELLPLLRFKGVDKPLEKVMRRSVGYTGSLASHQVHHAGEIALKEAGGINLRNVESWSEKPVVHFDWKTRCKGCEHLQRWGGGAFCVSRKTFEEHNQEAKDAGLLPGGKRPEKKAKPKPGSKAAEKEAELRNEQRERSLGEKVRDYLHARLCVALIEEVPKRQELMFVLTLWRALEMPGSHETNGARPVDATLPRHGSLEEMAGQFTPAQLHQAHLAAVLDIVNNLPWRETHALSRLLWGNDLHTVWNLDREFLDLFRKAELVHLAVTHGCELPEGRRSWDALKGDEIKDALLAQHDKLLRPAILADLYQGEIEEPYQPWQPGGGCEDDDDDSPDTCEHGVGFDEDCERCDEDNAGAEAATDNAADAA